MTGIDREYHISAKETLFFEDNRHAKLQQEMLTLILASWLANATVTVDGPKNFKSDFHYFPLHHLRRPPDGKPWTS